MSWSAWILYREDPELIARGITSIFEGEMWVCRKFMAQCISSKGKGRAIKEKEPSLLTPREKEILAKLASGETNTQIAEKLFISQHTVKTHLYNIFKKINVPNRLQAALWITKNL
jgi:LuxR family transcriptional regulator of csgAB operon